ncbi:MAG: OadG family protein [Clostridia bacterium]|nr:OadG family protein [Clostridia bacterium]
MYSFLLDTAGETLPFSEKMAIGGQVTLLGMGTVFSVLIILWGIIELLHFALKRTGEKTAPAVLEPPAPTEAPAEVKESLANGELIAVIAAAIAASEGVSPTSFRVVSFKRANRNYSSAK